MVPMENLENLEHIKQAIQPEKEKKGGKGGARETLYRVTLRNQLRSISIADQKANIIIGINTILISLNIAVIGAQSSLKQLSFISEIDLFLPLNILLFTCFVSALFAILAVRPVSSPWKDETHSKLFFRNFEAVSLEDFKKEMDALLDSSTEIYERLTTDMYLFGRVIIRKYRLMRNAYHIFFVGISLTVISFAITRYFIP